MWHYTVSHDQLLIRKRYRDKGINQDIYFDGVVYFELPVMFREVTLEEPDAKDFEYINTRTIEKYQKLIVLRIEDKKYYVAAAHMWNEENSLETNELPYFTGV